MHQSLQHCPNTFVFRAVFEFQQDNKPGYRDLAPPWCGDDLRPVVGTSCDFRFAPDPLTEREKLLLLSLWRRIRVPCLPNSTALRTWFAQKVDVPYGHGPDHRASPHSVLRQVDVESLFQIECAQIATSGDTMELTREQRFVSWLMPYRASTWTFSTGSFWVAVSPTISLTISGSSRCKTTLMANP